MSVIESIKQAAQQLSGIGRPTSEQAAACVRKRKASALKFGDDGFIPNHPRWPLIVYKSALKPSEHDPAAVLEELFASNGWNGAWRNGVYDYVHYHSQIHEVLGVARGEATVQFGGPRGRTLDLKAGDIAILPAGTGHQCRKASDDFLVVGAYPPDGKYDVCTERKDHDVAVERIPRVTRPALDPVYGSHGTLKSRWPIR